MSAHNGQPRKGKGGENMKVQLMNKISQVGLQVFDETYTYGGGYKESGCAVGTQCQAA